MYSICIPPFRGQDSTAYVVDARLFARSCCCKKLRFYGVISSFAKSRLSASEFGSPGAKLTPT